MALESHKPSAAENQQETHPENTKAELREIIDVVGKSYVAITKALGELRGESRSKLRDLIAPQNMNDHPTVRISLLLEELHELLRTAEDSSRTTGMH